MKLECGPINAQRDGRSDSIGRTVLQTIAQKTKSNKPLHIHRLIYVNFLTSCSVSLHLIGHSVSSCVAFDLH